MRILVSDGFGGCLSALSFAHLYYQQNREEKIILYFICSEPVLRAIGQFIPSYFEYEWHGDSIREIEIIDKLKLANITDQIYVLTPDFFGTFPGYSIESTDITWGEILEHRFLKYAFTKPKENNVFLGLLTAQDGNSYPFSHVLIDKLCRTLPDYNFYFANVSEWLGKKLDLEIDLKELTDNHLNFKVYQPQSLAEDLIFLGQNMRYFIGVDNGIMNYAYCLGRERILLDSRYGNHAFEMRWRHGNKDSVSINWSPTKIVELFDLLVKNPELFNLDKQRMLNFSHSSFLFDQIGYKTKKEFNK